MNRHPLRGCDALQQGCVTAAVASEAEVGAHSDLLGLQGVEQNGLHEVFGAELRQLRGEGHQHQLLNAQGGEQVELFTGEIQPQPRFTEQHLAGVGPEADDTGNGPLRAIGDRFGDDVAMAGVQPVKASQGQRGGLAGIRR